MRAVLRKEVSLIFLLTNSFQCYLFECLVCICVFCLFTLFLSVLFVFQGKNLLLLNLISRYFTSTSEQLLKSKNIAERNFLISVNYPFNVIHIAIEST